MNRPIKLLNLLAFAAVAIFVGVQFVRFPHGDAATSSRAADTASALAAPAAVHDALDAACYDCHSNRTRWPWYSYVAPVSWWVNYEVTEGRRRLNFSEWADYASDPGTEKNKLDEISTRIRRGDMAPWYYRLMHPDARLTPARRNAILRWISAAQASGAGADSNPQSSSGSSEGKK